MYRRYTLCHMLYVLRKKRVLIVGNTIMNKNVYYLWFKEENTYATEEKIEIRKGEGRIKNERKK